MKDVKKMRLLFDMYGFRALHKRPSSSVAFVEVTCITRQFPQKERYAARRVFR